MLNRPAEPFTVPVSVLLVKKINPSKQNLNKVMSVGLSDMPPCHQGLRTVHNLGGILAQLWA